MDDVLVVRLDCGFGAFWVIKVGKVVALIVL